MAAGASDEPRLGLDLRQDIGGAGQKLRTPARIVSVSRPIVSTSAYEGENHEQGVHLRIDEHLGTQIVTDKYPPGTILSTEAV
jgi:hypothetical protein